MRKSGEVDPSERLYNSRILATYIKFLRKEYPNVDVADVLEYSGVETYQVEDEAYWCTQEQVDRFNERVENLTRKNDIAREAGRFGLSPDSIGVVKSYILGHISIGKAYEMVAQISPKMVKSCEYASERLAPNKVRIRTTPRPGVVEKLYQCQNRIGYLEAMSGLFKNKFPEIVHTKCVFSGDECCEYDITWREYRYEFWQKVRVSMILPLAAAALALFFVGPFWGVAGTSFAISVYHFASSRIWKIEKEEIRLANSNLSESTNVAMRQMEESRTNMDFARKVVVALSLERNWQGMMDQITSLFRKELDYDRGMIFLANKEKTHLVFYGSFGYTDEYLTILKDMNPSLRPDSTGVFTLCFKNRTPFLVNDIDDIAGKLSPRSLSFSRRIGTKAFICVPIVSSDVTLGILAVDNTMTKRPLLQSDLDLLMNVAPEIGMAFENVMIMEDKEHQFHSILKALASSIDARDPLTAGHSERVTRLAVGIAREMRLPYETVEMIRVAALLHDYGKIGIADNILKKPGKLTDEEYEEIKTHATKTKQILDKIEFQGIYREVPDIACAHHEKYDGSGYPKHIGYASIPLGARILAVADVFEAITAKRHYRGPMPLEEAFSLLERDRGRHFDPEILDAFFKYYHIEGKMEDAAHGHLIPLAKEINSSGLVVVADHNQPAKIPSKAVALAGRFGAARPMLAADQ